MQKFRGKGPQNAGNGISRYLDLKIFREGTPPDPPTNARFLRGIGQKKTLDPPLTCIMYLRGVIEKALAS